jgi:O-antigen/teichoic acid export membrane protein
MLASRPLTAVPARAPARPARPLSLRGAATWTFVGNVVYAACSWLMLVVLAKRATAEVVGQFALALAITAPVVLFANLQLRSVQATDASAEVAFADYLALRLLMMAVALVCIGGLAVAAAGITRLAWVVFIVGAGKAVDAVSDVIYGLLQQRERLDAVGVSLVLKGTVSLVGLAVGQLLTGDLLWGAVGWSLASVLVLLAWDVPAGLRALRASGQRTVIRWHAGVVRRLLAQSAPLGLESALKSLNVNVPRYFLARFAGAAAVGYFAAISYVSVVGQTLVFSVGQAALSRLSRRWAEDATGFRRLVLRLVGFAAAVGALMVLAAVLFGPRILALLYRPGYAAYSKEFTLVVAAAALGYVAAPLWYAVMAMRAFTLQLLPSLVLVVVSIATCAWLIPVAGVAGAAWSVSIGSVVFLGCLVAICAYLMPRRNMSNAGSIP